MHMRRFCYRSTAPSAPSEAVSPLTPGNSGGNSIGEARDDWFGKDGISRAAAIAKYGNITDWDTHLVTGMASLFDVNAQYNDVNFNDDVSKWDVASVTTMQRVLFLLLLVPRHRVLVFGSALTLETLPPHTVACS